MERGLKNKADSALLIPFGSIDERLNGEAHLLEHILCRQSPNIWGITREDYILLFMNQYSEKQIINLIQNLEISEEEVDRVRRIISQEIVQEYTAEEEINGRKIWQATVYEKSPLGTLEDLNKIKREHIEKVKRTILTKYLFFYKEAAHISRQTGAKNAIRSVCPGLGIVRTRKLGILKNMFNAFYFHQCPNELYMLKEIMKIFNPGRCILLSEKRKMAAFLIDQCCKFPDAHQIPSLKKNAIDVLYNEIEEIKSNFINRALNELETLYFRNLCWEHRILKTIHSTDTSIVNLMNKMKDH
jgi:hypothetical protein